MGKKKNSDSYQAPDKVAPLNEAQAHYLNCIESSTITFGLGPAGTGKTYCAVALAGDKLYSKDINQIIITRPAVEAGEKLGYLPGELEDKYAPYLEPVKDIFISKFGKGWYESQIKNENIKAIPLGFLQGKTFDNCFVIGDEMQNSTRTQMYMLLTRLGKYSKMVLNGSLGLQKMISGTSGLADAVNRLESVRGVSSYEFDSDDVVRSGIAKAIVQAYER